MALVAGAGGALGNAVAVKLAAAGYTVVGLDRDEAGLAELPEGVRRVTGDPTDPVVPKAAVDRIVAEVGAPEVLVNTIGAFVMGDALAVQRPNRPAAWPPTACRRRRSPTWYGSWTSSFARKAFASTRSPRN
ncbi:SDR family NAD(P)-dependent oxidoreductase [Streptomyces sp. NPDC046821]|uniref:SDR family NAD(P)-dependent oxidoreductase n=1 Tax=Streptomyces sp. NPDC046821 TaxID=3154702 RepID=UPI0033EFF75A